MTWAQVGDQAVAPASAGVPAVRAIAAFLDAPRALAPALAQFWSTVTGWPVSEPRGEHAQFRSLVPPHGPAYLKVQELERPARLHLDLSVTDPIAERGRLLELGASHVLTEGEGSDALVLLTSPAGLVFCLVADRGDRAELGVDERAPAWPRGHRSRPAQVALDVPDDWYDDELAFWAEATGWTRQPGTRPEFCFLIPPGTSALQVMMQRLEPDSAQREAGAHLDIGTDDVPGEVVRLLELGAVDAGRGNGWWVMRDPVAGLPFCVTPQQP